MRRLTKVLVVCLLLSAGFSTYRPAAALSEFCQAINGATSPELSTSSATGGASEIAPGEVETVSFVGSGATPATAINITGTGAPGIVSLPYTYNQAIIPDNAFWTFDSISPGPKATYVVTDHCGVPAAPGVIWFTPGDGRVDGKPGDRIAVWCNPTATPPTIVVYGVGDASNGTHGFWLGTFNIADLLKAGAAGITKSAGLGNGTVSLESDGNGDFYAAWAGSSFSATGQGDFAKSFSCTFQS